MAEEQGKSIDERLAAKDDMEALRLLTKAGIEALRISMDAKIETTAERTKAEILRWMFSQTIVIIAAMTGILRAGAH